jgi:RNA polymerase sigma-70 factor (ECF subfamily)
MEDENRDDDLIRAHLNGSDAAFKHLVERHASNVAAVLERMVKDHHLALDLVQEVFIKLYGMLPQYEFKGRFPSLLYSMALNRARDALRKRKRTPIVSLEEHRMRETRTLTHDPIKRQDERLLIEEAMNRVPAPFKEALCLRDIVGLSYQEMAEVLECNLGTVKSRVNRGRLAFRDHYTALMEKNNTLTQGGYHASS